MGVLHLFVIPANARIHFWAWFNIDSRFRGNDERECPIKFSGRTPTQDLRFSSRGRVYRVGFAARVDRVRPLSITLTCQLMRTSHYASFALATLALSGCASSSGSSQKVTYDEPPAMRWSGSLQPTQQRSAEVTVTSQNRASGTLAIELPTSGGNMQRAHVTLSVAIPQLAGNQMKWAILPDRCGSGDLPLIGFQLFPLLEIGSNGRAELKADLPLDLVANNAYHINVYNGGQQLTDVFACGNLRYETRK
ncbi:hypothetical protein BH09GEM1_BH09GEM1_32000 [soil metagenome]